MHTVAFLQACNFMFHTGNYQPADHQLLLKASWQCTKHSRLCQLAGCNVVLARGTAVTACSSLPGYADGAAAKLVLVLLFCSGPCVQQRT
jgi:hypothetical protein